MMIIFKCFYRILIIALWTHAISAQSLTGTQFTIKQIVDLKTIPVTVNKPGSIAVSLYGDVFITDSDHHYLIKIDALGKYLSHTGGFGWKDEQLDSPKDVSTYDGLNIYVADYQNRRIQRFNRNLQYISSLGGSSETRLSFESKSKPVIDIGYPAALSISPLGDLFYVNQEKNQVIKINASGSMSTVFGGFESGRGQLAEPKRIKVSKDRVFVLDQSRIVIFDYFGNYLGDITHPLIKKPADIEIDRFDRIFVAETNPPVILIFKTGGQLMTQVSDFGFEIPAGLAVAGNRLYVLDSGLMQIIIYQISESR